MASGPSRSSRFVWNAGWNAAGQVVLSVLSLLLVPFIVRRLGADGYALYSLLGIISGFLTQLALGSGSATTKFVSELTARKDSRALGEVLWTAGTLHAGGAAIGALLLLGLRKSVALRFFNIQPALLDQAFWVLGCAALGGLLLALTQFGLAILQGLQRFDLANLFTWLQSAAFLGGTAWLLAGGRGLRSIGALFVAAQAAVCAAALRAGFARLPGGLGGPPRSLADARMLLHYSGAVFLGQLAWSVVFQWDKFFIAHSLPLSQMTYYLIPSALLQKLLLVAGVLSTTAFPMFSELQGAGDEQALRIAYRKVSQLVLWVVVPGCVMLWVLAPQFLSLWLGETFSRHGTWPLRVLLAGYFVYFLVLIPGVVTMGTGNVRYGLAANVALALSALGFWWVLIPRYGILGAAWGFLLAQTLANGSLLLVVNAKLFRMPFGEYLGSICARPFGAGAALLGALWLGRMGMFTWGGFLALGAVCGAVYLAAAYLLLDDEGRQTLHHVADVLRERLAFLPSARG